MVQAMLLAAIVAALSSFAQPDLTFRGPSGAAATQPDLTFRGPVTPTPVPTPDLTFR